MFNRAFCNQLNRQFCNTRSAWRYKSKGLASAIEEIVGNSDDMGPAKRRHPAGLRGKEIGLYYARKNAGKRRETMELQLRLESSAVSELRSFLESVPPSTEVIHTSTSGHKITDKDNLINNEIDYWNFNDDENLEYKACKIERDSKLDNDLLEEYRKKLKLDAFQKIQKQRFKLPAFTKSKEIVDTVSANQVVVISGETGCGKTTQVPQFILDSFIEQGKGSLCNIICTQPRRIAAISIAEHVASERYEECSQNIGYHIRLENKAPKRRGSIVYCTTGIVLKYLQADPQLLRASHIILDEIHERDLLSDFLMIILKDILVQRPDLKLVVMSATLNAEKFSKYFGNCPMLSIPGFTYPVKEYYLEDIIDMIKYRPNMEVQDFRGRGRYKNKKQDKKQEEYESSKDAFIRSLQGRYHSNTIRALHTMDEEDMDFELMKELIKYIDSSQQDGAILVFLPGWEQISKLNNLLCDDSFYRKSKHLIIPLHSMMPTINQRVIFEKPPQGVRKIVLATNIAETSITIDDVVYVVDSGRIKISNFDSNKVISTLTPEWVSLANARQRRGRAGRVQPGICYHLYTSLRTNFLDSYQLPEILRTRLEELCLQIKILKLGKICPLVRKAMDPPSLEAVEISINLLKQLKALDENENLTSLGYQLAQLPLDPQTGKMILLGSIFSCIDPILTIVACLNFKDPFIIPLGKEAEADRQKQRLSQHCKSDHLLVINAYEGWRRAKNANEQSFCYGNFLSSSTLRMLEKMKSQIAEQLYQLKLIASPNVRDLASNRNSDDEKIIRALVFGGLYPNIAKLKLRGDGKKRRRPPPVSTVNDGKVSFHPKSVCATETEFESCWLTYHTKVKSTQIFLHDVSMISALPFILFSEKVVIQPNKLVVDNNYNIMCNEEVAQLVLALKNYFDKSLQLRYVRPSVTDWNQESSIFKTVANLISREEVRVVPVACSDQSADNDDDEEGS